MRPLHNLPVWVVLRLCTDDDRIGTFWSAVDRQVKRLSPRLLPRSLFPWRGMWDCFLPHRHCHCCCCHRCVCVCVCVCVCACV